MSSIGDKHHERVEGSRTFLNLKKKGSEISSSRTSEDFLMILLHILIDFGSEKNKKIL
jgi:hypothetical protein